MYPRPHDRCLQTFVVLSTESPPSLRPLFVTQNITSKLKIVESLDKVKHYNLRISMYAFDCYIIINEMHHS